MGEKISQLSIIFIIISQIPCEFQLIIVSDIKDHTSKHYNTNRYKMTKNKYNKLPNVLGVGCD